MSAKYTYLFLMLGTIVGPVLLSFDKRVSFYKKWKFLYIPLFITLLYFVIWDSYFTKIGIWNFNDNYILGWKILLLPIEEWLFFILVPFACIFIYECANFYIKKDILQKYAYQLNGIILLIISVVAILNFHKTYTSFNFISAAILMAYVQFILKPTWLGRFYIGYFISLIPFFLVNGILTYLPVVTYNNAENLGIRIFTIPIEDTIYCLLLLLMNVSVYEWLMQRKNI
ncbi:MAG TPA: lycopene cyclase domain-containing protein [Chitinophagales bacterium]|nr:lycopene cyclase domain-containing protein [Chitinophagales bacterium]